MIGKNESFSDCMNKHYYECYAKIVLEEFYPKEFVDLKLKDRPDLQTSDNKFGIEVTNARDSDQIKAENLYNRYNHDKSVDKEKLLEEINKYGCKLENDLLIGKHFENSFDLILIRFNDKLKKLVKYKSFKHNCLFIFSDIYADNMMIIKAIEDMQKCQMDKEKKFYKVFLLIPGNIYCLNLYKGKFETKLIDSNTQVLQACKARNLTISIYDKVKDQKL
ncbi:hypothetical protein ACSVC9_12165 [Clostridium sp. LBM24168]